MRVARALGVLIIGAGLAVLPATLPAYAAPPPVAPTGVLAISGHESARLGWFGPSDDGGSSITRYRIYVSGQPGFREFPSDAFARTISGLTDGVSYTFRVSAVNVDGEGPMSAPSNAVTPRPRAGSWINAAPMATARISPLATKLTDGRVLVVNGTDTAGTPLATAELFNPATNSWTSAGLPGARTTATLTLLPNGRALLAGGSNAAGEAVATSRLYNPATNSWSTTGSLAVGRADAEAVLLSNGKVLISGGILGAPGSYAVTASAELYDPATGTWATTGSMVRARQGHSLNLINGNSQALAAGGSAGGGGFTSSEKYRPTTGTWALVGSMSTAREFDDMCCKTSLTLSDGRVLVAGGYRYPPGPLRTAEAFRSSTNTWAALASMRVARQSGMATVRLSDGRVLVVGGSDDFGALAANDLYRPSSNSWVRPDDLRFPRYAPAAVLLNSGRVLVVGGSNVAGRAQASTEAFTP